MQKPVWHEIIMSAQSTDETTSTVLGPSIVSRCSETTFYVEWSTGVTAGEVIIETASHPAYAGTWAPIGTVTYAAGAPHSTVVNITGAHLAMRARINTAVANGSVTVTFVGN